tara:strand:- start:42 stop:272 length:231 start_codon:yes stop_codon:yes gene_type:complete
MSLCSSLYSSLIGSFGLIGAVFAGISIFYCCVDAAVLTEGKASGLLIGVEVHGAVKTPQFSTFTSFFTAFFAESSK